MCALAAPNENDKPLQGCADCRACHQIAARGHASDAHICWKKGLKGGKVRSEQKRHAEAERLAKVRLDLPYPLSPTSLTAPPLQNLRRVILARRPALTWAILTMRPALW